MARNLSRRPARRGTIVPLLAVCVTALFMFIALAVDMGVLMVARTECQNAADTAALTGTRTLDNRPSADPTYNNNKVNSENFARLAVKNNVNLNANFTDAHIDTVRVGLYDYDTTAGRFNVSFPATRPTSKSWGATEVIIRTQQPTFFARVWGINSMPVAARAVAVHRPRDIALVLDFSGSMANGTVFNWGAGMLSPDPCFPQFGHYARYDTNITNNPNANAGDSNPINRPHPLFQTAGYINGSGELYAPNNFTVATSGGPSVVKDFYFDPSNLSSPSTKVTTVNPVNLVRAFHRWDPSVSTTGNPTTYVADRYNYSGYSISNPVPAPENFGTQSDSPILYVGDKWARKYGATSGTVWTVSDANGAAANALEYLGWVPKYTGVSTWQSNLNGATNAQTIRPTAGRPGIAYRSDWSDFMDKTWETYGYDLKVDHYIANRGSDWDPRNVWGSAQIKPLAEQFKGYSMGPGYWGKTFFMWPPDPRDPVGNPGDANYKAGDWRTRYFGYNVPANPGPPAPPTGGGGGGGGGSPPPPPPPPPPGPGPGGGKHASLVGPGDGTQYVSTTSTYGMNIPYPNATTADIRSKVNVNWELLRNGNGNMLRMWNCWPNYTAILRFIKAPPQTLPTNLRAGRIVYYTSIPDDVNSSGSDPDQRFWKEYIHYVLGIYGYGQNERLAGKEGFGWPETGTARMNPTIYQSISSYTGYKVDMYRYDRDGTAGSTYQYDTDMPYMNYKDNPARPRLDMWFGPQSMLEFISGGALDNWMPGTCHEAQAWQLKAGINSAVDDIRNNHPNDCVGMAYFSGYFNPNNTYDRRPVYTTPRAPMSQEYKYVQNALFYPNTLVDAITNAGNTTTELRPYETWWADKLVGNLPNSNGYTDPLTGFAEAYNLLSPAPSTNAMPTRRGRRGATKIVIFETDGIPNCTPDLTYNQAGYNSTVTIRPDWLNWQGDGNAGAITPCLDMIDDIVALASSSSSTGKSGFSLPNSQAKVYAIGYGDLFDTPTATGQAGARDFLLNVQKRGKTSPSSASALPTVQIITGPYQTRIDNLRTALERILQGGVQVTLIE